MKHIHIFVSGRVQGVGFRNFTKKNARALGLKGYVKNLSDGRVEIETEGPKDKLKKLLDRVKEGPLTSNVKDTDIEWGKPKNYSNFKVRY